MTVTRAAIDELQMHWAVKAITEDDRLRAAELVNERLAKSAVGRHIAFDFVEADTDNELLGRVALAYQMATIEGLDELATQRPPALSSGIRALQPRTAPSISFASYLCPRPCASDFSTSCRYRLWPIAVTVGPISAGGTERMMAHWPCPPSPTRHGTGVCCTGSSIAGSASSASADGTTSTAFARSSPAFARTRGHMNATG